MNQSELRSSVIEYFGVLADPRVERTRQHKLIDIIGISVCAVIAGADSFTDIERYGQTKQAMLEQFLELPNGIPSHDTFGRFFAALDPVAFHGCFVEWVNSLGQLVGARVVAIDGKTARGSHDRAIDRSALHTVSAWCSANRIVLAQQSVATKSNEIIAIPELLRMLWLEGATVTIDAMGTQREIAAQITEQKADYVLTLKQNHPTFYQQVDTLFAQRSGEEQSLEFSEKTDAGHGRVEVRRCWSADISHWALTSEWPGLRSVAMIERERHIGTEVSIEHEYYISSLPSVAAPIADAVRTHWGIENQLHWVLDVTFGEDASRVRINHAAENFVLLRKIALNLLRNEPSKESMRGKRKIAGWNDDFMLKILTG